MDFGLPQLGLQPLRLPSLLGRQDQGAYQLDEEEKSRLLAQVASGTLGGIATLGAILDTPGSIIRNTLAGENPFKGLFNPEERTSGRTLLEKGGILGPNQEGFDWGDVGGFAAEVALDPFLWISGPARALTGAGKLAKSAGILDTASRIATKAAGESVGPRVARLRSTLGDLVRGADVPQEALKALSQSAGRTLSLADPIMDEKLGALGGFGIPFKSPSVLFGGDGGLAEAIARKMDVAGDLLRHGRFSPIRPIANLFSVPGSLATTREGFTAAKELEKVMDAAQAGGKGLSNAIYWHARQAGLDKLPELEMNIRLRKLMEGVIPPANQSERSIVNLWDAARRTAIEQARSRGTKADEWADLLFPELKYAPRHDAGIPGGIPGAMQAFGTTGEEQIARSRGLMGIGQGTGGIMEMASNQGVRDAVAQTRAAMEAAITDTARQAARKAGLAQITAAIKAVPGQQWADYNALAQQVLATPAAQRAMGTLTDKAVLEAAKGGKLADVAEAIQKAYGGPGELAKKFLEAPDEQLARGFFGNFPLYDLEAREFAKGMHVGAADVIIHTLTDNPGVLKPPGPKTLLADTVRLEDFLKKAGMNEGPGAYERIAQRAGIPLKTPGDLELLKEYRVKSPVAEDLLRSWERFTKPPEPVRSGLALVDTFLNWWKAGVTGPWLAFAARNLGSGQFQEWFRGTFSASKFAAVKRLLNGEVATVGGLTEHPLVKSLAAELGITGKLTDAQASDLTRMIGRQFGTVPKHAGEIQSRIGAQAAPTGKTAEDFANEFVGGLGGGRGITAGTVLNQFLAREPGLTYNPLKGTVRGAIPFDEGYRAIRAGDRLSSVTPAVESTLAPVRAGETMGHYVETLNRLPGFLEETAHNVNPIEAARRVGAAQVQYSNRYYTPFEQVLTRLFPFGKFTLGQTKYLGKELAENPGGRIAQAIRATTAARETGQPIPEYVSQSLAIPIPEGTPLIGPEPGGPRRYLSALQLMHEDPAQFLGGGLRGAGLELMSRMNPLIKGAAEYFTGESFFQRGEAGTGGRPLSDLDPGVGRLIANIAGWDEPARIGTIPEQLLANSPFSRLITTARTLTDPRKRLDPDVPIPGPVAIANTLTGARFIDVTPAAEEAMLREGVTSLLKDTGVAKVFERTYVPKDALAQLPPETALEALRLQALLNLLAERAQKRARGETIGPINTARSW